MFMQLFTMHPNYYTKFLEELFELIYCRKSWSTLYPIFVYLCVAAASSPRWCTPSTAQSVPAPALAPIASGPTLAPAPAPVSSKGHVSSLDYIHVHPSCRLRINRSFMKLHFCAATLWNQKTYLCIFQFNACKHLLMLAEAWVQ